jgi:hypothetical protein
MVAGVGAAITVCPPCTASVTAAGAPAGAAVEEQRVVYDATETSGDAVDHSGYGNDGALRGGTTRRDGAYRFHPHARDGHYDRIVAPSAASLNPGTSPFSYGARLKVRPDATWSASSQMAVLRHGDLDTPGGDFKLELKKLQDGHVDAICEMHDGAGGSGYIQGRAPLTTLADGAWHEVTCARVDATTMALVIDGQSTEHPLSGDFGEVVNDDAFLIGCQPFANRPELHFREQFNGALDDIHLTVTSDPAP